MVGNVTRDKNGTIIKFGMSVKKKQSNITYNEKIMPGILHSSN